MHNLLQTLEDTIVHVIFYERWIRSLVDIARGRREKLSVDLEKVPMPIATCANVSNRQTLLWVEKISKTIINEIRSKFIAPRITWVGHCIKRIRHIFRRADIGKAEHRENIFALRRCGQLGGTHRRMTLKTLRSSKVKRHSIFF